jgi:hypothetical protein
MVENIELILISLLILILSIISFLPLIYLNYAKDLNNNINNYNNICDSKKNIYESNINIKNTYMWNLCNHLFDFNVIQKNFKNYTDENKPTDKHNDIININRDLSIVNGEFNIMKVYNDYLHSSLPLFIVMWIFFILHIINISYNIKNKDSILKYNYFLHSSSYLFLHVAVITIIFSLILKKITEIYADTKAYEYIMLLKEFDILIKENKTEPAFPNNQFMTIIKNYSGDDISSVADIIFTKDLIDELADLHRNIIGNGEYLRNMNGYKITLENIDNFRYYNNKKTIEKCNEEIEDVTRFTIVYFIILFFPIYMLSQASKSNFTTNAVITIVIFVIFISGYIVKKKLE